MAEKKRILIVTQEMKPYTNLSEMSGAANRFSQFLQENGMEVRILMPRFGTINERRHRLHEVVRLSGMNINVDDDDYPLIIKVASLPGTRMQVYFLDNEELFKRKHVFANKEGELFEDNLDRTIFFNKGVIETVKKFGWAPDVVHCHGWMTSLLPAYLKTQYKNEPIFQNASFVYSAYPNEGIDESFAANFSAKANANQLESVVDAYQNGAGLSLNKGVASFVEGVIAGSADVELDADSETPSLAFQEEFTQVYLDFYNEMLLAAEENV